MIKSDSLAVDPKEFAAVLMMVTVLLFVVAHMTGP